MSKFSLEEKLEIVLRYLEGKEDAPSLGKEYGVSKSQIYSWVRLYEKQGVKGFRIKGYTSYPPEFKLEVLEYRFKTKASYIDTAAHFGIPSPSPIKSWVKEFETKGYDAFKPKKKGRLSMKKDQQKQAKAEISIEALQAELEHLRMENAYLKKLNALVQNKEKSPNKTKRK
jgi:transposase